MAKDEREKKFYTCTGCGGSGTVLVVVRQVVKGEVKTAEFLKTCSGCNGARGFWQ